MQLIFNLKNQPLIKVQHIQDIAAFDRQIQRVDINP